MQTDVHNAVNHIADHTSQVSGSQHGSTIATIISMISFMISLFIGTIGQTLSDVYSWHIPPVLIEGAQFLAALVAIIAGVISIRLSRKRSKSLDGNRPNKK